MKDEIRVMRTPRTVDIDLTARCNLRCRYCYFFDNPAVEYHEEHRRAVREAPLDRLLLETDSPVTYGRGSAHEFVASPVDVRRSLKVAAELKGHSEEEIAAVTTENAEILFEISG